tara:strand:- start:2542 stop:3279 length:738 start_codon:yes stop_codon:yes gene_type:complete
MMHYFIAAPFGNYLKYSNKNIFCPCVSVTGTWTLEYRGGWSTRLWRMAKTLRYSPALKGWTNSLGLPNEGLVVGLKRIQSNEIMSIAAIKKDDWKKMAPMIDNHISLELNLSCPNVSHDDVNWDDLPLFLNSKKREWCIAKVSPLIKEKDLSLLIDDIGFKQIHLCNTLPVDGRGGLSGPSLKPYTLSLIETVRKRWGDDLEIIAGGGVQDFKDVSLYMSAGSNHISLGSVCFKPWKVKNLIKKR